MLHASCKLKFQQIVSHNAGIPWPKVPSLPGTRNKPRALFKCRILSSGAGMIFSRLLGLCVILLSELMRASEKPFPMPQALLSTTESTGKKGPYWQIVSTIAGICAEPSFAPDESQSLGIEG